MRAAPVMVTVFGVFSFFLMAPGLLSAQDISNEGKPISAIQVKPKAIIPPEAVRRLTGIEPGMIFSSQQIRNSIELLYRTGLFNDILVETFSTENGVVIQYQFVEKAFLSDLSIRGNWAFSDRALQETFELRIGGEFTDDRLKSTLAGLELFYRRHGYFQSQMEPHIQHQEGTNQVNIQIRIKEGIRTRIRETRFSGHPVYSDFRLWAVIRSRAGEFYDANLIERDLKALEEWYSSKGYLQAVIGSPNVLYQAESNEVILTYSIEAETRMVVNFSGNRAFSTKVLKSQLLFREERNYGEEVFNASSDRLEQYYQTRGYPFAKVFWEHKNNREEDTLLANFIIEEGPLVCLRSIRLEGNSYFSSGKLFDQFRNQPSSGPIQCKVLNPILFKEDLERIERIYREEGFLGVDNHIIPTYSAGAEQAGRATVSVEITIDEGIQTRVKSVTFTGHQVFSELDLMKNIQVRPGMPYNPIQAQKDADELLRFYRRQGYIFAKVDGQTLFSEDRSEIRLTYTIDEDQMARIGRIFFKGNTFTRDRIIERELKVTPGDPYNEEAIQLSRHRILKLGYLGDVRFQPATPILPEQKEYIKDMVLSVSERPPKAIEFGAGYADVDRFRGFAELSNKNLAGTGRFLGLRGEASSIERRSTLTFIEPWVFTLPMDARFSSTYDVQVRPTYNLTSIGGRAGIEKKLTQVLTASFFYQLEFNNFTHLDLSPEDEGRVNLATLNPSLIWDTRNDPFNPSSGTLSGIVFRLGARSLGSEVQIRKSTIYSNWFFPLTRRVVLALSGRGGLAVKYGASEEVPLSELFFVGGRSTVRGYNQDDLGILGDTIDPETGKPTGGQVVLIGNAELRIFLPGGLGLVIFTDWGNVWFNNDERVKVGEINFADLKPTVGTGLRYNTPVGPLRLDLGYKLDREKEPPCPTCNQESLYEFHFTLGHAF